MKPAALADLLRDCLSSGAPAPLAEAYADGRGARHLATGRAPQAERARRDRGGARRLLCRAGPPRGVDAGRPSGGRSPSGWNGWATTGEAIRQRHYLRLRDGRVERHWLYAARPHTAPAALDPDSAEQLFAALGPIAERTTLASSGWSGNRLDRLVLRDGRALIAKRIVPGADWLGRTTRDRGREALLQVEGAYARMPDRVDPAVVAAEREGDAWWIVMRDVSDELVDDSTPLTREQNRFVLDSAALVWEEFWDDAPRLRRHPARPAGHVRARRGRARA